jgi:predicted nucleotidyltransferase
MGLESLLAQNKDKIREICRRHGASNIRVFGSVARHDTREESDIDFLVDLHPGRTLFDLGGLAYDLEQLLGQRVDVATPGLLRARIRSRIMQEAVPL